VFGIGYQNESGKNCDEIGLIAESPVFVATGNE
jgi:hypothetical protein